MLQAGARAGGSYLRGVTSLTNPADIFVSSLIALASKAARHFCSGITRSFLRPDARLSGNEVRSSPMGYELLIEIRKAAADPQVCSLKERPQARSPGALAMQP
jgi:hypothetical protein